MNKIYIRKNIKSQLIWCLRDILNILKTCYDMFPEDGHLTLNIMELKCGLDAKLFH